MPNKNRTAAGKRNYEGSAIEKRNAALRLAASYEILRASDPLAVPFLTVKRVTSMLDFCMDAENAKAQVNEGNEPHLMVADPYNPGHFGLLAIYDRRIEAIEKRSGMCWIDVHKGECLVKPDTLVYWK
jgi:hypothetical protein